MKEEKMKNKKNVHKLERRNVQVMINGKVKCPKTRKHFFLGGKIWFY